MIDLLHIDCMEYMATLPDKAFDLAIVDPPYGIGVDGQRETFTKKRTHKRKHYVFKGWDSARPQPDYWSALFRVSNHQIIWGANYFTPYIPISKGWIFWDKGQNLTMPDGELAFTSMDRALRRVVYNRGEIHRDGAIHPTQKPVALYKWLLKNYAKPGDRILDTHLGSGSIAIACHDMGFDLVGCEIDEDYIQAARKRLANHQSQMRLL